MTNGTPQVTEISNENELVQRLQKAKTSAEVLSTRLTTDRQVIARITDGIYRQPASAFRELISNAYDADATRVVIQTDAPRFDKITVEDDGIGMNLEALVHLLFHIGGSAKRSPEGQRLGLTSKDPDRSPGGRKLIGKIGIGLFSVSQLTQSLQIITKVKGDNHRTVATIALRAFSDEVLEEGQGDEDNPEFESGKVNVWREKAPDTDAHGTTIVLTEIKPQAKDTLRSRDLWSLVEHEERLAAEDERQEIEPPAFHVGRVDPTGGVLVRSKGKDLTSVPWKDSDSPKEAFRKLVQCVWDAVDRSNPNPRLDRIFDYYLRMVWQLSLAVPLPYVEGHVFDEACEGWADVFSVSNEVKGGAKALAGRGTIRHALDLHDPVDAPGSFAVHVDNLQLLRPIRFRHLPMTAHALKRPLVLLGKVHETFAKVPPEISGGPLTFEAYLIWTPKVAPTEHQGSLIRIHGSSGTLFDPTFMRYQVSEQTRLRQITCEVFVSQGLEGALNIDRESFNTAHPHTVYITKWLHKALRQLATAQKRLASGAREQSRDTQRDSTLSSIQRIAKDAWRSETDDPASAPPAVEFSAEATPKRAADTESYVYRRTAIIPEPAAPRKGKTGNRDPIIEEKVKAIAQVLASYGLLDTLSKPRQERLLRTLYRILEAE